MSCIYIAGFTGAWLGHMDVIASNGKIFHGKFKKSCAGALEYGRPSLRQVVGCAAAAHALQNADALIERPAGDQRVRTLKGLLRRDGHEERMRLAVFGHKIKARHFGLR